MGVKGPIRDPLSRRGARELPNFQPDDPELPEAPRWLSAAGKAAFAGLVADLAAAGVPIKLADGHAVAMAAHCVTEAQTWAKRSKRCRRTADRLDCSKLSARFQRDSQTWLSAICATPVSRARLGLRGVKSKPGKVLSIIEAKRTRDAS